RENPRRDDRVHARILELGPAEYVDCVVLARDEAAIADRAVLAIQELDQTRLGERHGVRQRAIVARERRQRATVDAPVALGGALHYEESRLRQDMAAPFARRHHDSASCQPVKSVGALAAGGVVKKGFTISSIISPSAVAPAWSATRLWSSFRSLARSKSCAGTSASSSTTSL